MCVLRERCRIICECDIYIYAHPQNIVYSLAHSMKGWWCGAYGCYSLSGYHKRERHTNTYPWQLRTRIIRKEFGRRWRKGVREASRENLISSLTVHCTTKLTGGYIMLSAASSTTYLHVRRNFRETTHTRAQIYRHGLGPRLLATTLLAHTYNITIVLCAHTIFDRSLPFI